MERTSQTDARQTSAGLEKAMASTDREHQDTISIITKQQRESPDNRSSQRRDGDRASGGEQHLEDDKNKKDNNMGEAKKLSQLGTQGQTAEMENGATTATPSAFNPRPTQPEENGLEPHGGIHNPLWGGTQGLPNQEVNITVTSGHSPPKKQPTPAQKRNINKTKMKVCESSKRREKEKGWYPISGK